MGDLKVELDELVDSVSQMGGRLSSPGGATGSGSTPEPPASPERDDQLRMPVARKRWSEYTSGESDAVGSGSDAEGRRGRRWGSNFRASRSIASKLCPGQVPALPSSLRKEAPEFVPAGVLTE